MRLAAGPFWRLIGESCRQRCQNISAGPTAQITATAMQAMLEMVKLDIEGLRRAYEGKSAA